MTRPHDLLLDAFDRAHELVPSALEELTVEELLWRPDAEANSIAWLVWHLTRVQDDHLAELGDVEQRYTADGWADRFGLPYPVDAIGYGQSSEDVGAFRLEDPSLLTGYHEAVHAMTVDVVSAVEDFDRVVDERWDPPVTVATRLVSVVNDVTQHVGQAAYVRGLALRRR
jgi:hypothetical protein